MRRELRNLQIMESWSAAVIAACIERGWIESWPLEVTRQGARMLRGGPPPVKMPPPPVTPWTPPEKI